MTFCFENVILALIGARRFTEENMAQKRRKLGEILHKAKLVDKQALIKAIKLSISNKKRLGEILIEQGLID